MRDCDNVDAYSKEASQLLAVAAMAGDGGVHILILPTPGIGHIIPLAEFAKKLHYRHSISATFIIPTDGPLCYTQTTYLSTLPPAIDHLLLPPVNLDDLPPDVKPETRISLTAHRSMSFIRAAVESLISDGTRKIAALVVDLFGTDGFEIALDFGIPPYIFFPSSAMSLSLFLYMPELDRTVSGEYREMTEKVRIPGCVEIRGTDLVDPFQDRTNDAYKWFLHHAKRYTMAQGIILNSFKQLEPDAIQTIHERLGNCFFFPVGPVIAQSSAYSDLDSDCLKWLNEHPESSVLYVSFGSGGSLCHEQIIELAFGLEMSEQRFLWIVRSPNNESASATYFRIHHSDDPLSYLPAGFLERTHGRGLVVPRWGPQGRILAHSATGGFLTHCGWNSALEGVANGMPLILWPLYAEQRMNAALLRDTVKVGLRVENDGGGGVVGRAAIAKVIKDLMEGEEGKQLRSRAREMKNAAAEAESDKSMVRLADTWREWVNLRR